MDAFTLENERALLIPLTIDHFDILLPLSTQVDLYSYGSSDISTPEKLKDYIQTAITSKNKETALPFVIYDKQLKAYGGSTRFGHIDFFHKVVHIGWTWLGDRFRGSGINHHMKFLMLRHAFEVMGFEKVEFRIDERNMQSRKAVEKLGAVLEGILRKNIVTKNEFRRSSACYGILKEEWPAIKSTIFKGL